MRLRNVVFGIALASFFAVGTPAFSQAWVPLANQPDATLALSAPLLLTDGTVMLHEYCGRNWFKLSPDQYGSYINGTWRKLAPLPVGYAPLYFGSAVLADGRVVIEGGEYNNCQAVWTNLGAIYDPKKNTWASMPHPPHWSSIGDAQAVVLPDGTYMQANCCSTEQALLNPKTLKWTITGKNKFDVNDEEGWTLLPDGTVLTVDAYVFRNGSTGKNYEIYNPATGAWHGGKPGGTIVQLWDSYPDGRNSSHEVGPAVLRPDGTVFATGATGVPGAGGHTAIYDTISKTWKAGPDFPDGLGAADGPASILPNGNVLVQASPGIFNLGSKFLEWNGTDFINVTGGMSDAPNISSFYGNMLALPTGEILFTDFGNVWVFRPHGKANAAWLPRILSARSTVHRGKSYVVSGLNMNGFTQGAAYGDDAQSATNYPLVRFTNRITGNVYYERTHDHSTMAIAYSGPASTTFDVSTNTETGLNEMEVVVNGIVSDPVTVNVE